MTTIPFFTIITATYNAASTLPRLLDLLVEQTFQNFQLIIQDGASTDKTLEIIEKYQSKIPHISVQSEKDTGIYDAWNKALPRIQGEWVLFLGADDSLYNNNVLLQTYEYMSECELNNKSSIAFELLNKAEAIAHTQKTNNPTTKQEILFVAGSIAVSAPPPPTTSTAIFAATPMGTSANHDVLLRFISGNATNAVEILESGAIPTPFPGLFIHASIFTTNSFDSTWRIAGDYDFLCSVWTNNTTGITLPFLITNMQDGGISNQYSMASLAFKETIDIAQKHFGNAWTLLRYYQYISSKIVSSLYTHIPHQAATIHNFVRKIRGKQPTRNGVFLKPQPSFNPQTVPIFIVSYNRLTYLQQLITWLEKQNLTNIIIVDNNSSYPPLVEYLQTLPYRVEKLEKNIGHLAVWQCNRFAEILENKYYIVTDPDVIPNDHCPYDVIMQCYNYLQSYQHITKCGFSLNIDDIPHHFPLRSNVMQMEEKFWQKPLNKNAAYFAPIDTTFALYRPGIYPEDLGWMDGIRLAPPYSARHLSWYENPEKPSDEITFYQENIKAQSSFWSMNDPNRLNQENIQLRVRIAELEAQINLLEKPFANRCSLVFYKILRSIKNKILGK